MSYNFNNQPEIRNALASRASNLKYCNPDYLTVEDCINCAERTCGASLEYTPERFKTPDFYKKVVTYSYLVLSHVTDPTYEVCLAAVTAFGAALQFVPEELKSAELCSMAVNKLPSMIEFVPELFQDAALCERVVNSNGLLLQHVKVQTPELCLKAISPTGAAYQYVRIPLSEDMIIKAVQTNCEVFMHLKAQTPEICMAAVTSDGYALEFVLYALKTPEICLAAVQENGHALRYVPTNLQSEAICLAAVQQNGGALQYVANPTRNICFAAVQENGYALEYVPSCYRDYDMHLTAVKSAPCAIKHVSALADNYYQLCVTALRADGSVLPDLLKNLAYIDHVDQMDDLVALQILALTSAKPVWRWQQPSAWTSLVDPTVRALAITKDLNVLKHLSNVTRAEACLAISLYGVDAVNFIPSKYAASDKLQFIACSHNNTQHASE